MPHYRRETEGYLPRYEANRTQNSGMLKKKQMTSLPRLSAYLHHQSAPDIIAEVEKLHYRKRMQRK